MEIVVSPEEMAAISGSYVKNGKKIAFVPTMGALHQGHLSLIDIAKKNSDICVMSVFVNPTQFGPKEDFCKYPRPFEEDCFKARNAGCDIVFAPTKEHMYPEGYNTYVSVETITRQLCGASRPGHFRGVATVVLKFINIVQPAIAIFGQKDAQQVVVIKRMFKDLNHQVNIYTAPIIRESDGLAMSSRNIYLTAPEREEAAGIYRSLCRAEEMYNKGNYATAALVKEIHSELESLKYIKTEYVEIVDTVNLSVSEDVVSPSLIAIACRTLQSGTRLIDNVIVGGVL